MILDVAFGIILAGIIIFVGYVMLAAISTPFMLLGECFKELSVPKHIEWDTIEGLLSGLLLTILVLAAFTGGFGLLVK